MAPRKANKAVANSGSNPTSVQRFSEGARTIRAGMKWATYCVYAWCAMESVKALAGQHTVVDALVSFMNDESGIAISISWTVTVGAVIYGRSERRLRQRNIEASDAHIKRLELAHDPIRSSSELTKEGRTNPSDLSRE